MAKDADFSWQQNETDNCKTHYVQAWAVTVTAWDLDQGSSARRLAGVKVKTVKVTEGQSESSLALCSGAS